MTIKWVVLANASQAYIYTVNVNDHKARFALIKKTQHAESKKKRQELISDRPGHYKTRETMRGAYSSHTDPKEVEKNKFAKKIVDFFEKNRTQAKYDNLVFAAGSHFYGLMNKHFSKPLYQPIEKIVAKEIIINDESELKNYALRPGHNSFLYGQGK